MCGCGGAVELMLPPVNRVPGDFRQPSLTGIYQVTSTDEKIAKMALKTLRRIPEDVFLDLAIRDLKMGTGDTCIVGWAVRLELARAAGADVDNIPNAIREGDVPYTILAAAKEFGGTQEEWSVIYFGVIDERRFGIELAFIDRINELVQEREES